MARVGTKNVGYHRRTIPCEEANAHSSAGGRRIVKNRWTDAAQRSGNEARGFEIWGRVSRCARGRICQTSKSVREFRPRVWRCVSARASEIRGSLETPVSGAGLAWIRSKVKPTSIHHVWIIRPAFRLSPRLLAKFMCRRSLRSLPTLSANSSSCAPAPAGTRGFAITVNVTNVATSWLVAIDVTSLRDHRRYVHYHYRRY